VRSRWGVSDNNRKARFYEITAVGRRQTERESQDWARTVDLMNRFLNLAASE